MLIWPVFVLFEISKRYPPAHRSFLANKHYRKQYDTDRAQYDILVYQEFHFTTVWKTFWGVCEYYEPRFYNITIIPNKLFTQYGTHLHAENISICNDNTILQDCPMDKKIKCSRMYNQITSLGQLIYDHKGYLPPFKDLLPYIELWKQIKA